MFGSSQGLFVGEKAILEDTSSRYGMGSLGSTIMGPVGDKQVVGPQRRNWNGEGVHGVLCF